MIRKKLKSFVRWLVKRIVCPEVRVVVVQTVPSRILEGRTALISGGSGGLGYAIAAKFVASGCRVILSGTDIERLRENCRKLGSNSRYVILDITRIGDISEVLKLSTTIFGEECMIDILVNAAGVHGPSKFAMITEHDYDTVMDVNLKGTFFLSQAIAAYMIEHGIHGNILNVSSASALKPGRTPYEISKWGVRSLTLGLAAELIGHDITVNAIAPGPVATAMLHFDDAEHNNLIWPGNPGGRVATPEEIAELALFMVGGQGRYIVGDSVYISGGSGTICNDC